LPSAISLGNFGNFVITMNTLPLLDLINDVNSDNAFIILKALRVRQGAALSIAITSVQEVSITLLNHHLVRLKRLLSAVRSKLFGSACVWLGLNVAFVNDFTKLAQLRTDFFGNISRNLFLLSLNHPVNKSLLGSRHEDRSRLRLRSAAKFLSH
jgi:hypothetical protein